MSRIAWIDASAGVSGDMLLGALHELGALGDLPALVASLPDLGVSYDARATTRSGLAATECRVVAPDDQPVRGLDDVLGIVAAAAVRPEVRARAEAVFRRLADVEATAHGTTPDRVHFHEVGAVDAIVDVLGGCLGLHALDLDEIVASPIALGSGSASGAHGALPVPTPAVLALLAGTPLVATGEPAGAERATPTGVALLAEWATDTGAMPPMRVAAIGAGAGSRDDPARPNLTRIVLGTSVDPAADDWRTIAANVDDLDPRLWPGVLDRLLAAGAADAWLTPIVMKKGRPAHTVSALVAGSAAAAVRAVLFAETSTIGLRETEVTKHALDRATITVDVAGEPIRVKVARDAGRVVNAAPEFEDVAAAARQTRLSAKEVLARATAAAWRALGSDG